MKKLKTRLRTASQRFLSIRGQPRDIALGFAFGLFVGITPFLGLHTAMAVFFAAVFKWSKIAAAMGVWICNPVTAPIIYAVAYLIGSKLTGISIVGEAMGEFSFDAFVKMLMQAPEILWALTIGGAILGLPIAVIGYYLSFSVIQKYQAAKKKKSPSIHV